MVEYLFPLHAAGSRWKLKHDRDGGEVVGCGIKHNKLNNDRSSLPVKPSKIVVQIAIIVVQPVHDIWFWLYFFIYFIFVLIIILHYGKERFQIVIIH